MGHRVNDFKNTWTASVEAVGIVNGCNQLFDFARAIRVSKSETCQLNPKWGTALDNLWSRSYLLMCFVILASCANDDYHAQYMIQSIGVVSIMTPSTGQITLDVRSNGSWSKGVVSIETDSLHLKDSVICSNLNESGTPFFDGVLVKSGHRLMMHDHTWGLFKKGSRQVVFFTSKPKPNSIFHSIFN